MMDNTDFDLLCDGASPEEAKRLRKVLAEWCNGDEYGFPAQLALLTRTQWRAVAKVPRVIQQCSDALDRKQTDHRQQLGTLASRFDDTVKTGMEDLAAVITLQTKAVQQSVADSRAQLATAESVARKIQDQLDKGSRQWEKAREAFDDECKKLEKAREALDSRETKRDWMVFGLLLLAMVGVGIGLGLLIAHKFLL